MGKILDLFYSSLRIRTIVGDNFNILSKPLEVRLLGLLMVVRVSMPSEEIFCISLQRKAFILKLLNWG